MDCEVKTLDMEEGNLQSLSGPNEYLRLKFLNITIYFVFKELSIQELYTNFTQFHTDT